MANSSPDPDPYPLARDKKESDRLREQHDISIQNAGYLIFPAIVDRLPSHARIADVAAGTGVWAMDVAKSLPKAQLVAFDLSSAQFPPSAPDNVQFVVTNAKQPFPDAYHGSFDLVHIRALIAAMMSPEDWDVVMCNIIQLLKPGGSVQWGEADFGNVPCLRNNPEYMRFTALPKLLEKFRSVMGDRATTGPRNLVKAASARLENVEVDVFPTDRLPEMRARWARQAAIAMLAWAEKSSGWSAEELAQMKSGVQVDIDNGAYHRGDIYCVTGQKPHASTE